MKPLSQSRFFTEEEVKALPTSSLIVTIFSTSEYLSEPSNLLMEEKENRSRAEHNRLVCIKELDTRIPARRKDAEFIAQLIVEAQKD